MRTQLLTGILVGALAPGLANAADDRESSEAAALEHYSHDRYAEAALAYEQLWREHRLAKYLYNAGLARHGQGHTAHALMHWRMFLRQPNLSPKERAEAENSVALAVHAAGAAVLVVEPAGLADDEAKLELRYLGPEALAGRTPLRMALDELPRTEAGGVLIQAERGTWSARVEPTAAASAGYRPAEVKLTIEPGRPARAVVMQAPAIAGSVEFEVSGARPGRRGIAVEFVDVLGVAAPETVKLHASSSTRPLRAGPWRYTARGRRASAQGEVAVIEAGTKLHIRFKPMRTPEQQVKIGTGLGLGVAGAAIAGAGAGMLAVGEKRYDAATTTAGHSAAADFGSAGAGFVGAGVGLWTGAVTGAVRPASRRAWFAELGVGLAAAAGGATWFALGTTKYTSPESGLEESSRWHTLVGAGVAGLGAGLVTSSVVGLIASRKLRANNRRGYSIAPAITPTATMLRFSMKF